MHLQSKVEIVHPAPILNTADFNTAFGGMDGTSLPKNAFGHPKHFEFVALPKQIFTVEEIFPKHNHCIYRISSSFYLKENLFLDSRFVQPASLYSTPAFQSLCRKELSENMKKLIGVRYVWGGNWSAGIPELLRFYPPQKSLDTQTLSLWSLQGVDCSGLLYEASQGNTPRNTSDLLFFGDSLPIEKKSPQEIESLLLPMDMVVWPGHVWFVLDATQSIESKSPFGVICRNLSERLQETCAKKQAIQNWHSSLDADAFFTIRRFTNVPFADTH